MKRFFTTFLPSTLLIASCSLVGAGPDPHYVKPGETDAKMKDELHSCQADAQEAISQVKKDVARPPRDQREIIDQCMKAKGYLRPSPP